MAKRQRPDVQSKRSNPPHAAYKDNNTLVHLPDELVDVAFPVAEVTTLNVVLELRLYPATVGVRELDGPEEVGGLQIYMSLCVINMLPKFDRPA